MQDDSRLSKLVRHRWIHMLVGTGDFPAFLATELGQSTHEGAANTDDMDFQS